MRIAKLASKLLLAATLVALPTVAHADTFSWSIVAAGVTGSGTFTATPSLILANAENVTSASGTVNGFAISLVPGNYSPTTPSQHLFPDGVFFNYDNIVYTSGPQFDYHGLLLVLSNGIYINFFNVGALSEISMLNGDPTFDAANFNPATATIKTSAVIVPEPSTLLLLGTGLIGLSTTLRRKLASR